MTTSKRDLQLLFPTAIQVSEIDDYVTLNAQLMAAVDRIRAREPNTKPQSWSCDLFTTIGSPQTFLEEPGVERFARIALDNANEYALAHKMDIHNHPPKINECWINIYAHSHAQDVHLHQNSVMSGIYFVKAPPGSAPTLFHAPTSDVMLVPPHHREQPSQRQPCGLRGRRGPNAHLSELLTAQRAALQDSRGACDDRLQRHDVVR